MKYFIYVILISGFIGFVTYATIETNKTISQNPDPNTSAISDASTASDINTTPSVDAPTIILPNDVTPSNNIIQQSPTKIKYEDNEREDD
ncbi:MAG: hypothetical protein WCW54_02370 [Candidatus Paceibacterota bacterium]